MRLAQPFRKKPVTILAIEWNGGNLEACKNFLGDSFDGYKFEKHMGGKREIYIKTLEGRMTASCGDYIIKGIQGEFYPCKPDIFKDTYEGV